MHYHYTVSVRMFCLFVVDLAPLLLLLLLSMSCNLCKNVVSNHKKMLHFSFSFSFSFFFFFFSFINQTAWSIILLVNITKLITNKHLTIVQ